MAAKNKYTLLEKLTNLQQCSFNLQIKPITQRQLNILLLKFESEYDCDEYDHQEEKKRYYNLMTYLHYRLRNIEEAKQCNEMALEIDPESIVALGNQAWMLYYEHDHDKDFKIVEQILQRVDVLFTDRVKLAVAKSEMAYSYARFGVLYYKMAETIYENVLNDVKCSDQLPVFLWQYGCGLLKIRCLRKHLIHDDTIYENTIKFAASLFSQVAKQDDNLRYKARALTELGNLAILNKGDPKEEPNETFSMAIKILQDNNILDIPVLEQYANHCNMQHQTDLSKDILFKTIQIKKSPKALILLSKILCNQIKRKHKGNLIPDNTESKKIIQLYDSAIAAGTIAAMGYKGKFLMLMGNYKKAIEEFEKVYRSLQLTDPQQEELNWKTKFLCETCHAKCLNRSSNDAESIKRSKTLLWSAIELCVAARTESHDKHEKMKLAAKEMLKLLSRESKTKESILEEIIMCELVGQKDRAEEIRRGIEQTKMGLAQQLQIEMAQKFIKIRDFNEGLILLNQMMVSNTLPKELIEFAIKANIDGAEYALENRDVFLATKRVQFAFEIRFANDNSYISHERLHLFVCANEHNQNLTQSVQECITKFSSLNITTCFDAMPGRLRFSSLEDAMLQSSVLVILLDDNDMKNNDIESRVFQISVEMAQFIQIKHKEEKSLMIITVSDQCVIPDRLSYVPHLPLGKLFQEDKKMWMHAFLQRALLK